MTQNAQEALEALDGIERYMALNLREQIRHTSQFEIDTCTLREFIESRRALKDNEWQGKLEGMRIAFTADRTPTDTEFHEAAGWNALIDKLLAGDKT